MTRPSDDAVTEDKIVVFFDVCSSTTILEDLLTTGNLRAWRNLLIATKNFLRESSATEGGMDIYNFIGDGWVLLFPSNTPGEHLIKTLTDLSCFFYHQMSEKIIPLLQSPPEVLGITFGAESGTIIRIRMLQNNEYIGRPLNVAARLQSAVKDNDSKPQYKLLISKHLYRSLGLDDSKHPAKPVVRHLRNLLGGRDYHCMKLALRVPGQCRRAGDCHR